MRLWYFLKHRKVIPYKYSILDNPIAFAKESHKHYRGHRRIRFTKTKSGFVSTVFLGLDHNYREGKPITFETAFFKGDKVVMMERVVAHRMALKCHQSFTEKYKHD